MSVTSIDGKRILFFSPAFFNYENMIADKMKEMGALVDMYDVRSVTSAFDRALLKISPSFFKSKSLYYYEDIIEQNKDKNYDFILIVKCDMTPISVLKRFKKVFPNAKLCLNLWDSVDNIPGISEKFKYFDTIHSFDLEDCNRFNELKFRPLFFGDEYKQELKTINNFKYDISFLGTVHSDRFSVIKQVQDISKQKSLNCYWFLFLQSKFIYYYYKITKKEYRGVDINIFSFDKMSASDVAKIISDSRIILDIQHPKQTGLTMRTIEMIGMNKKLITTNKSIINYDFYNSNNIFIIDRQHVEISSDFLIGDYCPISQEIYNKYSLRSWILEVLS